MRSADWYFGYIEASSDEMHMPDKLAAAIKEAVEMVRAEERRRCIKIAQETCIPDSGFKTSKEIAKRIRST